MSPDDRSPERAWPESTCLVCPAQRLGIGAFDVVDGPGDRFRYDPTMGCRVDVETGSPVCVHPFRVGLSPGAYASHGVAVRSVEEGALFSPSEGQLQLPSHVDDLEAWLIAVLRTAEPEQMASALDQAEAIAADRFISSQVVDALRRVLAHELPE